MLLDSLYAIRKRVSIPYTSIQLSILGLIGGVVAACLIVLFRLSIDFVQAQFEPGGSLGDISPYLIPSIPILAAILIAVFADFTGFKHYRLGIPFVLHRIKAHYGDMPLWNSVNQFVGGVLALGSGFSVGREGPSVHIGASGSSWLGHWLKLPHNAVRTLTSCGIAAGISASFNTPLAAVIFVMEVVLREYKIHVFIPVMLASSAGSLITQAVFGQQAEFEYLSVFALPVSHYPFLIMLGLLLGASAFVFNSNLMRVIKTFRHVSMFPRLIIAGAFTAFVGYFVPEALGDGTSAINLAMLSPTDMKLIIVLLFSKLVLTWCALGLGIPGGIIGPIFGLGVLLGLVVANVVMYLDPSIHLMSTYGVLGMAGLMASSLHAPLAALVAVMELTSTPTAITPAIIVIATAYITSAQVLKNRSIFIQQLNYQGLAFQTSPAFNVLSRFGVLAELNEKITILEYRSEQDVRYHLNKAEEGETVVVSIVHDLGTDYSLAELESSVGDTQKIKYWPLQTLNTRSTLAHVYELLEEQKGGAALITSISGDRVVGIVEWEKLQTILLQRHGI